MALLETKFERQSFGLTTVLLLGLVLLLFFVGLKYLDPPDENGILISFGNSNAGAPITTSNTQQQPEPTPSPKQPEQQLTPPPTPVEETATEEVEEVLTEDSSEVVIPKEEPKVEEVKQTPKETPKETSIEEVQEEVKETTPKEEVKVEPTPEPPKPDQKTTDALSSILGATEAESSQGDQIGNAQQGDPNGDPYAASFYGSPNATGTEGYGLSGRNLSGFQVYKQTCDEEGTVVVRILVDKNGRVIEADPGIKGTTNNASCLLEPAKRTALSYRWDPDSNAPDRQIGFVVIHFKLGQ
jgi:outer membrane biosynthesis protein TonB